MELMSSAFLCVLVALLPQTLVKARNKNTFTMESQFEMLNNSSVNRLKTTLRKPLLLNINGPPLVNNASEIQSIFNDNACKLCKNCMDKAIKAYNLYITRLNNRPSAEELREDVFNNEVENRNLVKARTKRNIQPTPGTIVNSPKKMKNKKNKSNKTVTVTKYDIDGKVYALKVKETPLNMDKQDDSKSDGNCQVYSVKKSFSCESSEGEGLIIAAKRKASKRRSRKEQDKKGISPPNPQTTATAIPIHTSFRKREVDNSQVPENFMPSIEDFF